MPASPASPHRPSRASIGTGLAVFLGAVVYFGWGMPGEALFVDEAAFASQSYFWDLASSGRVDSPLWLEYPAYDLPPLPKYLIGASLQLRGIPRPSRSAMIAWYANIHESRFLSDGMLVAARWPSVLFGAIGCVAVFALGTTSADRRVGLVASVLLMANPLYRLHTRRAMADAPAEALWLTTAAIGLALWRHGLEGRLSWKRAITAGGAIGAAGGLAVLAKLNGGLGLMVVALWAPMAFLWNDPEKGCAGRYAGAIGVAAVASLLVFSLGNPFVTARPRPPPAFPLYAPVPPDQPPWTRIAKVVAHRVETPRSQQASFPHNALTTPRDKILALAVQGFGRFGPFGPSHTDSTRRFDQTQDRGAWLWGPWVLAGLVWASVRGRGQKDRGEPPTAWALAILCMVAMATVGVFLPLAWDRYFLSIQAGSALLAAGVAVAAIDAILGRGKRAS